MWRNYLTVGLRALAKNKTYAFINIFGLAIGLAACLLHPALRALRDQLRRMAAEQRPGLPGAGNVARARPAGHPQPAQPVPGARHDRERLSQIEAVTVVRPGQMQTMRQGQPVYRRRALRRSVLLRHLPARVRPRLGETALPNVDSLVLTESQALQQFGTLDVLGRTVTERISTGTFDYQVTGVIQRPAGQQPPQDRDHRPPRSRGRRDSVPAAFKSWGSMSQLHYVRLAPAPTPSAINAQLPAWEKKVIPAETMEGRTLTRADIMDLKLVNVADVHLGEAQLGALTPGNDRRTVVTFAIVALLILVMACINFINLSTARVGAAGARGRASQGARSRAPPARRPVPRRILAPRRHRHDDRAGLVELTAAGARSLPRCRPRVGYFGADGFLLPVLAPGDPGRRARRALPGLLFVPLPAGGGAQGERVLGRGPGLGRAPQRAGRHPVRDLDRPDRLHRDHLFADPLRRDDRPRLSARRPDPDRNWRRPARGRPTTILQARGSAGPGRRVRRTHQPRGGRDQQVDHRASRRPSRPSRSTSASTGSTRISSRPWACASSPGGCSTSAIAKDKVLRADHRPDGDGAARC